MLRLKDDDYRRTSSVIFTEYGEHIYPTRIENQYRTMKYIGSGVYKFKSFNIYFQRALFWHGLEEQCDGTKMYFCT